MSSFSVKISKIVSIEIHPNADQLELAMIEGWGCVVPKGQYKNDDIVVYVQPDSILPVDLADRLGVRKYLGGKLKNRVRCAKIRQVVSAGLIFDPDNNWPVGTDVAHHYGITKYDPPVKITHGDSVVTPRGFGKFTDIENLRNFTNIIDKDTTVYITEKIHGTQCRIGMINKEWVAGSKEICRKRPEDHGLASHIYWHAYTIRGVKEFVEHYGHFYNVVLYGEVYGKVQSLRYGKPNELGFVAFGLSLDDRYIDWKLFSELMKIWHVPTVPVIWIDKYNIDLVKKHSQGPSILAWRNGADHIREGVIVIPEVEQFHPDFGRVILKYLNDDYLVSKHKEKDTKDI